MYSDLNDIQIKIFLYIKEHIESKGYPPSIREIMKATDLKSTSTVHKHMGILESYEYIRRDPTKPRALEIVKFKDYNDSVVSIPLVGDVVAGMPVLATENIDEVYSVSSKIIGENDFLLRVSGDSMVDAGIYDKDYVIVDKRSNAKNGDIVIALLEDEATIKRFFKEKDCIRLQPENETMEAIYTKDLTILGIVKGIYRKL